MTDIATESQTDRIVRLALLAGKYARERDAARAACAGCVWCAERRERDMAERVEARHG